MRDSGLDTHIKYTEFRDISDDHRQSNGPFILSNHSTVKLVSV